MKKIFILILFAALFITAKSQSITVTYPNGGDTLFNCNTDTIRFTATGTSTFYNIDYSVNGGSTWQSVITNIKITNGKYAWTVPINVQHSSSSLIRVYDRSNTAIRDSSNAVFNIFKPITITSPNGGEVLNGYTYKTISWNMYSKSTSNNFTISYSLNGGASYTAIWVLNTLANATSGSYNWLIPTIATSTQCLIKVVDNFNNCKVDISDAVFTINPPLPIITKAGGGKVFRTGENNRIGWDTSSILSSKVRLEYTVDSGLNWLFIDSVAKSVGAGNGYAWYVPFINSTKCFIKILNNSNRNLFKTSDTAFTILPAVSIFSPFKGDTFNTCNKTVINFDKTQALSNTFIIEYQEKGSSYWNTVATITQASPKSVAYTWSIPQSLSLSPNNDVVIRVYPQGYLNYASYSDTFYIKNSISLMYPFTDGDFKPGDTVKIKWKTNGTNNSFDIGGTYKIGATTYTNPKFITAAYLTNTNTYDWIVPATISSIKISVRDYIDTCKTTSMLADATVSTLDPIVKLVLGNGGEKVTGCSNLGVTWTTRPGITLPSRWIISYGSYNASYTQLVSVVSSGVNYTSVQMPDFDKDIYLRIQGVNGANTPIADYLDYSDSSIKVSKIGFKAGPDTSVCYGSDVQLFAAPGYTNYTWSPLAGLSDSTIINPIAYVNSDRTYTVKANLGTCVVTDYVNLKRMAYAGTSSISISADTTSKCAGKTITVTSNTIYAGSNAVYKWFINRKLIDSSNNSSFTFNFKQNDSVVCLLYSSLCTNNSFAQSNGIKFVFPFTPTVTNSYINSCNNVTYKGNVYSATVVVKDTLKFIGGCDSVYNNMNITIKKITPTTKNINLSGCNSVTYNAKVYTTSTTLKDTVKSYFGCDSVFNVTNIIVNTAPIVKDTFATVCSSLNWYGTVYTKDTIASYIKATNTSSLIEGFNAGATAPTGFTFTQIAGTYTTAGNFGAASPSLKFGANNDQIISPTLPAAATQLSFWLKNQGATGCSFLIQGFNGTSWTTVNTITTFPTAATTLVYNATSTPALPSGLTKFRFSYTKSAGNISFDDLTINYNGASSPCDSVVRLNLTVNKPSTTNINLSGCVVVYKGITYKNSATVSDTLKSNLGCDSIYKIANITIIPIITKDSILNITACNNATYKGNVYTSSTAFLDTIKTMGNCDSIYLAVNIFVNHNFTGNIKHPTKGSINNVTVKLNGSNANTLLASGKYAFNCLPNLANGSVKPSKNNDIKKNNGVSSIDVILVQNHILNRIKLNSPYKIIAADVNNNKSISNIDIIFMKRLILGIDTTFTGNRLWAFVDSSYQFPDTTNPFPYKDSISFTNLSTNKTNQTFIGVKLGDVNYDWNASLARGVNLKPVELVVNSEWQIVNGEVHIPVKVNNFKDLTALQYSLNFNSNDYEFVAIENNKLGIEFNAQQANKTGNISMLWANAKGEETSLEDGTLLFELVLKPKKFTTTNDFKLTLNNEITEIEAWDKNYQQHNIILTQKTKDQNLIAKDLFTVSPNPTSGEVVVNMLTKENKIVVFELVDAQGNILFTQSSEAVKGNNVFKINLKKKSNLPSGLYFLKANGASQRLVVAQ